MNIDIKNSIIKKSIAVLNAGGTILYPTDTVWGIGCDATNAEAIAKVYEIKKRSTKKPLILLMHNKDLLNNYINSVPKIVNQIINKSSRPTTIIYNNPINLPKTLIYQDTIAIRIIKKSNLNELLNSFKKPITSTSANISGNKTPDKLDNIDDTIKNSVDYIIPEAFVKNDAYNKASKLIKIIGKSRIEIIRN
ncbi:MAG: threonylcarbamoyl-AMP synthase [Flavobacteriales bacterium TMED191]|nr:MAG: threonylcarbamoyl-AMP synthase [Flavobacteriales bacterium TMED191]|tara:strand:+ start:260 stop:838 length:579 start_codon:yes stop_codon:yes gene_type:complete